MTRSDRNREQTISRAFVELADTLVDDFDVIDLLSRLVGHCVELMSADAAAILIADLGDRLRVVASTDEDAEFMEAVQLQNDEGPCLECFRAGSQVSATRDEIASRWPAFSAAIAHRSVFQAVYALPLRLRGETVGVLNLFFTGTRPIDAAGVDLGQGLADVATIAILQERAIRRGEIVNAQLQSALVSRVVIEQAKGVLAQHRDVSVAEAFEQLRGYSRRSNQRLTDVARALVERRIDPRSIRLT